jgi:hypothetical protein
LRLKIDFSKPPGGASSPNIQIGWRWLEPPWAADRPRSYEDPKRSDWFGAVLRCCEATSCSRRNAHHPAIWWNMIIPEQSIVFWEERLCLWIVARRFQLMLQLGAHSSNDSKQGPRLGSDYHFTSMLRFWIWSVSRQGCKEYVKLLCQQIVLECSFRNAVAMAPFIWHRILLQIVDGEFWRLSWPSHK